MTDVALKKVCRFCLEQDPQQLEDIFAKSDESGSKMPLAVQVMSCVSIEIFEGDEMPTYCCRCCRKLMEVMYQYKQICRKSDVVLKQCMITGKLPGKFELPMKLVKECLPKESFPVKVDCCTNTEVKKSVSKASQTEKEQQLKVSNTMEPPKEIKLPKAPVPLLKKAVVLEQVTIKPPSPKRRRMEDKEFELDDQIEILELTQSEVDKLQPPVFTKVTIVKQELLTKKKDETKPPVLLNKSFEKQKPAKAVIEFQKFVMNDNGDCEVEILEEVHETGDNSVFSCDFCPRTFIIKQQLELHLDTHFKERNFSCEMCDNKFMSKNDLVKHLQTHTGEKAHTCVVCNRSFARSGILKRHQLQHKEHLKYHCASCPEKFITEQELAKHVDFVHNKPRPFPCQLCEKAFAFKQGLERHMTSHDPTQNSHSCEICHATFPTPTKLQQHLPKHAGKRRYPCKYCPKTFILSHHLSRHVRNTHTNTKAPKQTTTYTCTECPRTFQNRDRYIKHTAEHTTQSLICPLCKMKFKTIEAVDGHIEEHALATEHFSCELCSCAYLTEQQLEKHFEEEHDSSELVILKNEMPDLNEEEDILYEDMIPVVEKGAEEKVTSTEIQKYFDKLPKSVTIKKKK